MMSLPSLWLLALFLLSVLPPFSEAQNCGVSRRRPWRSLSCTEQEDFLNAMRDLKDSGAYDDIAQVHWQTGSAAHQRPEFLPWHRYYIWIFEQELQRVSNSCMSLPYWDWERDSLDTVMQANTFGSLRSGCVTDGVAAGWRGQNGCLQREFNNRFSFSRDVEVLSRITNSRNFASFSVELEGAPHSSVHQFIGGTMSNNFSPLDPLFWLHHANVDRIWTLWQNYNGHAQLGTNEFDQEQYSADLDASLVVSGDDGGFFGRPTVREVISTRGGLINVQYIEDNLARSLVQTSDQFANAIEDGWNSPGLSNGNPSCDFGNIINNNNVQPVEVPQEAQEQPVCRETSQQCNGNSLCCSGLCTNGQCIDETNGESGGGGQDNNIDDDNQRQPEEQPTCRPGGGVCNQNSHCCSGWCSNGACREDDAQALEEPSCRNDGESCSQNSLCCSGWCSNGECREEDTQDATNADNGSEQQCRRGGQACFRHRHCCSRWCDNGECWEEEEQDQQPQSRSCLDDWQGCVQDGDCCSGWCRGRVCWAAEGEETTNNQPSCSARDEFCYSDSECCSGRCRWGSCRSSSGNNLRRAQVELNKNTQESGQKPGFSSPALDARWQELVDLYGTSSPGRIFDMLGREDCENRTKTENRTIESASLDFVKRVSNLDIRVVHTFDCHSVIGQKEDDNGN